MGFILTFSAMMLAILLLAGCATEQGLSGEARHQASTLQCVGYCDLTITDKTAGVTADVKLSLSMALMVMAVMMMMAIEYLGWETPNASLAHWGYETGLL